MKRVYLSPEEIADWGNLERALWLAAQGKRDRGEVREFLAGCPGLLAELGEEIRNGTLRLGQAKTFEIRDPKPRTITAPCFRERVLHHALIGQTGPVLDRAMGGDSFGCRVGKGTIAAVKRAQALSRRFPWLVQIDMAQFFASIDHAILKGLLRRRFKGDGVLGLFDQVIDAYPVERGKGLPIGALTSQHLANFYLAEFDRLLEADRRAGGMVRYMDDVVFWTRARDDARALLGDCREWLGSERKLSLKREGMVQRSQVGMTFCGYRVFPNRLRLTRRRKRSYVRQLREAESAFVHGRLDSLGLQAAVRSAWETTRHAEAAGWRRNIACRLDP